MSKLTALLIACLALGLVAVGCGGGDDGSGDDTGVLTEDIGPAGSDGSPSGGTKSGAGEGGGKAGTEIDIVDIDYEPKNATVKGGTTVRWTNTGELPHTVTKDSGPGADFDSGTLEPGESFEVTVDHPGEIGYLCTIHAGQTGTLTVE